MKTKIEIKSVLGSVLFKLEKEKHPDEFWCMCDSEAYPIGCKDCCGKVCKHYEDK